MNVFRFSTFPPIYGTTTIIYLESTGIARICMSENSMDEVRDYAYRMYRSDPPSVTIPLTCNDSCLNLNIDDIMQAGVEFSIVGNFSKNELEVYLGLYSEEDYLKWKMST